MARTTFAPTEGVLAPPSRLELPSKRAFSRAPGKGDSSRASASSKATASERVLSSMKRSRCTVPPSGVDSEHLHGARPGVDEGQRRIAAEAGSEVVEVAVADQAAGVDDLPFAQILVLPVHQQAHRGAARWRAAALARGLAVGQAERDHAGVFHETPVGAAEIDAHQRLVALAVAHAGDHLHAVGRPLVHVEEAVHQHRLAAHYAQGAAGGHHPLAHRGRGAVAPLRLGQLRQQQQRIGGGIGVDHSCAWREGERDQECGECGAEHTMILSGAGLPQCWRNLPRPTKGGGCAPHAPQPARWLRTRGSARGGRRTRRTRRTRPLLAAPASPCARARAARGVWRHGNRGCAGARAWRARAGAGCGRRRPRRAPGRRPAGRSRRARPRSRPRPAPRRARGC